MKVAPVSADLLIKLAMAGVVVGVAVYYARRVAGALPSFDLELPDVGAWVDRAGAFVGEVGTAVGEGATWVGDNLGGRAHITDPATFPPLTNPWGIYLTAEQQRAHDAYVAEGTVLGSVVDFISRLGNQVPTVPVVRPDVQVIATRGRVVGGL